MLRTDCIRWLILNYKSKEIALRKKLAVSLLVFLLGVSQALSFSFAGENKTIILATTTSVQDTGLLDLLVAGFQKKSGYTVKAIAVGTGQAMQLGQNGEADILWVHSPADERQFVKEGYGTARTTFMHNDFVVLGPKNDPAKIKGVKNIAEGFRRIATAKVLFVSRGDNSGTHKKEKKLWQAAGVTPDKEYYIEIGQGMAATVNVANEKLAYCLADRSTYLSLKKLLELVILFEGDEALFNRYSLILVNPEKYPKINAAGAKEFFAYLLSEDTKNMVENYGQDKFGQPLFYWDYK
ncbi:MAG: extracellular solute-binding protein [Elusimicrobia bacterium]|nr:extracellular solute-binding protein [Elusimicrobiota bacterium]